MKLETVVDTINCASKYCPTIYKTDRGSFIVQGNSVSPETAGIAVASHEGIVEIPEALIQALVTKLAK